MAVWVVRLAVRLVDLPLGLDLSNALTAAGGLTGLAGIARWGISAWLARVERARQRALTASKGESDDLNQAVEIWRTMKVESESASKVLQDTRTALNAAERASAMAQLELERTKDDLADREATIVRQAGRITGLEAEKRVIEEQLTNLRESR